MFLSIVTYISSLTSTTALNDLITPSLVGPKFQVKSLFFSVREIEQIMVKRWSNSKKSEKTQTECYEGILTTFFSVQNKQFKKNSREYCSWLSPKE